MKRIVLLLSLFAIAGVTGASAAHAAGLGFYGSVGGGSSDWTVNKGSVTSLDFSKDTGHIGFGLAMDTAPAQNKLFNYQLNLGYDRFSNRGGSAWGSADFNSLVVSNNFGFGKMISPTTRLWFGPELRVSWVDGSPDNFSDYKIHLFGIGVGPVLGMNLNYDDIHTLVLKMGFQYIGYIGEGNGKYSHSTNAATAFSNPYDYDVTEKMLYVTVGYLFRTSRDR